MIGQVLWVDASLAIDSGLIQVEPWFAGTVCYDPIHTYSISLNLTDDQKSKLSRLREAAMNASRPPNGLAHPPREQSWAVLDKAQKRISEK